MVDSGLWLQPAVRRADRGSTADLLICLFPAQIPFPWSYPSGKTKTNTFLLAKEVKDGALTTELKVSLGSDPSASTSAGTCKPRGALFRTALNVASRWLTLTSNTLP